ncbi:MAG TPA: phosphoribosyltransferase family protein [Chitinophagaceae bacterium]|nr:phosphoribosyltransferase family protein [Chitinophagaceae bacterium]
MLNTLKNYTEGLLHLFFPHNCEGCGTDILDKEALLCAQCFLKLPDTNFFPNADNPVEKIFYGRLPLQAAGAGYYFTKNSLMQHLMIELKYHNNKDIGIYLGKLIGIQLQQSKRFDSVDVIVPLPLNEIKEKKRTYNQAMMIAEGIAETWNKPIVKNAVERTVFTETQTHKDRITRWQTMEGVFRVSDTAQLNNKHILLIDDIVTTGATLEACGIEILKAANVKLSIATVAYTI